MEEYKLYLNVAKTEVKSTPFITNIAVGKRELKYLLDSLHEKVLIEETVEVEENTFELVRSLKKVRTPYAISQSFIKDYQCIVKRNNLTYDVLSKDVIRFLKSVMVNVFKHIEAEKNEIENFLLLFFDIAFYAYSLNVNSSTTFKLAQMIVLTCKYLDGKDNELRQSIFSKISKESDFVMLIFQRKSKYNETNVETLNLLIALKKIGNDYLISENKLRELFNLKDEKSFLHLNYFHLVTILYYIDNNGKYINLKKEIECSIIKKFQNEVEPFIKAELTFLFFDIICCPFVSDKCKRSIIRESKYATSNFNNVIAKIEQNRKWFMNWEVNIDLERILKNKEWGSSY